MLAWNAKWIVAARDMAPVCPEFLRRFDLRKPLTRATLYLSAMGTYEAHLNGNRVGSFILAPGYTTYRLRHQYQCYDVTELLAAENTLTVTVGPGWYGSRVFCGWAEAIGETAACGIIARLELAYADGTAESLVSDESWQVRESAIRFSDIYDGETADARVENAPPEPVAVFEKSLDTLIPQEGPDVTEQERVQPRRIFTTPAGETVIDFGQEITGYVEFTVDAHAGDELQISHGEVLDADGNFYNANYRSSKSLLCYICKEGVQTWKPRLTFFGFRYIRLDKFPGKPAREQFTAILVCSEMQRTGRIRCGVPKINRLFENVLWGQRDNFLDIPTDCPQRDERRGWTGDAQVFAKTASYNYDVRSFFRKWLHDMTADQYDSGEIPPEIPFCWKRSPIARCSAAWADAAIVVPWQMYRTYGDVTYLSEQYETMRKYLAAIGNRTTTPDLWTGDSHYGDWLGLDAPSGSYKGSTRDDFIASAFYYWDAGVMAEAAKILGKDPTEFENLRERIGKKFKETFTDYTTQTECVLALHFGLTDEPAAVAALLAEKIAAAGNALQTGFVGTPYLLFALSENGRADLAYDLLLRESYPGWLYSLNKGATTTWEHWDSLKEDGSFWSTDMNSFNHYAYGSVMGWVYEQAAGITPVEPGFARVRIAPNPEKRLGWLEASIDTAHGEIRSGWYYELEGLRLQVETPVPAEVHFEGKTYQVAPGKHIFHAE